MGGKNGDPASIGEDHSQVDDIDTDRLRTFSSMGVPLPPRETVVLSEQDVDRHDVADSGLRGDWRMFKMWLWGCQRRLMRFCPTFVGLGISLTQADLLILTEIRNTDSVPVSRMRIAALEEVGRAAAGWHVGMTGRFGREAKKSLA